MPVTQDHYKNVLKFWRSVETFTLPDIPYAFQDTDNKRYTVLGPQVRLPWEPGGLPAVQEGKLWKHTLYFHLVFKIQIDWIPPVASPLDHLNVPIVNRSRIPSPPLPQRLLDLRRKTQHCIQPSPIQIPRRERS